ncbi:hypothetical protein [Streptomyces sp. NPDC007088]|uniref:hypothetical protein n=1 Tax=Streptomyces sp. NPDC007088 TaxID=3364773 RepID=UPI0036ADB555
MLAEPHVVLCPATGPDTSGEEEITVSRVPSDGDVRHVLAGDGALAKEAPYR